MLESRGTVTRCAGRELHWREQHGAGPTVVLMSGCGLSMEFWRDLVGCLPERRVLAYDRPGMGGTRWPGKMPTLLQEVASLAELMTLRQTGPAVLVAHSMASFHAEALARLHPELVAGVVLVDGSQEWFAAPPSPSGPGMARAAQRLVRWLRAGRLASAAFRMGTYLQSTWTWSRLGYGRLDSVYRDPDTWAMATAESMAYDAQAWDLQCLRPVHPWPQLPTIVLSAEDSGEGRELVGQTRLAALLQARQVVVAGSDHLMMLDRPDAIVAAIHAVAPLR